MLHWTWSTKWTYMCSEHSPVEWKPCLGLDARGPSEARAARYGHIRGLLQLQWREAAADTHTHAFTTLSDIAIRKNQTHLLKWEKQYGEFHTDIGLHGALLKAHTNTGGWRQCEHLWSATRHRHEKAFTEPQAHQDQEARGYAPAVQVVTCAGENGAAHLLVNRRVLCSRSSHYEVLRVRITWATISILHWFPHKKRDADDRNTQQSFSNQQSPLC